MQEETDGFDRSELKLGQGRDGLPRATSGQPQIDRFNKEAVVFWAVGRISGSRPQNCLGVKKQKCRVTVPRHRSIPQSPEISNDCQRSAISGIMPYEDGIPLSPPPFLRLHNKPLVRSNVPKMRARA